MRARWNEARRWKERVYDPGFWGGVMAYAGLRRWAAELERAAAAPAPRINLLSYVALLHEVPEHHSGARQEEFRPVIGRIAFDFSSMNIAVDTPVCDVRKVYIGYRWVP